MCKHMKCIMCPKNNIEIGHNKMKKAVEAAVRFLRKNSIMSLVIGALIGWGLSWILPAKPVVASNIPKKELTCTLNYSNRLVKKLTSDNRLKITYDDIIVSDPYLYDISILNSGNYAIDNFDFKEQFVISFKGSNSILSAQVYDSTNGAVSTSVLSNAKIDGENLVLENFFINPGEEFSIAVITENKSESVLYQYRISGISELSIRNTPKEKHNRVLWIMGSLMVAAVLVATIVAISLFKSMKRIREEIQENWNRFSEDCQVNNRTE